MLRKLLLTTLMLLSVYLVQAQISGFVYRDYNGNGTRETASPNNEPGVGGVIINAYNASNTLINTTTSGSDGSYTLPFTVAVRIEFVIPASGACSNPEFDFSGFSGDGNSVRFLASSTSNVNYGILNPDEYTPSTNPRVYVPIYKNGNQTNPLYNTGTTSGFTSYDFTSNGSASNQKDLPSSNIGATYGVAYSKQAKRIFTSAFIKRHVGLGPLGSGGIYMLEETTTGFNVTNFYDMDANGYRTRASSSAPAYGNGSSFNIDASGYTLSFLGVTDPESGKPEGWGVIGSNDARGLMNLTDDSYDPAAFMQVGTVGLGDLEISDDGRFLFVMNLFSRKVYRLELNNAYSPSAVISVTSYALPSILATNGEIRPFGLGYKNNTLYVGAVASGENGGSNIVGGPTDLYVHVVVLNNATGSASFTSTPILSAPLNYQKGYPISGSPTAWLQWFPWNSNTNAPLGGGEWVYPTPMLSDIDFSDRGDMILNFFDRSGHQFGYYNYQHLSTFTNQILLDVGGEILIAGRDCNTANFTLESNGSYNSNGTTISSAGAGNLEGPGGGEFFFQEYPPDQFHHECSQGSLAIMPGYDGGIFTLMDANSAFAGGTVHMSTTNGTAFNRLNLYGSGNGSFEKANGLGDIEISGDEPGIEIGNRVWVDLNNDGIQGPGEIGLNDVTIELYADFDNNQIPDGAVLASVTTTVDGNYYFNSTNVADGDPNTAGNQAGPQPGKTYLVVVGSSDWTSGAGVNELVGLSLATANVGGSGQPDVRDNDATLQGNVPSISVTTGKLGQNDHTADFGFVECTADAGPGITLTCSTPSGTIGTPAVPGNTYSWTPASGLNATNIAQPTASPASTTTYTLTVNGLCTDVVTVTVDNTPPTADAGNPLTLNCTTTSGTIGTPAVVGNTYSWSPSSGLSATNSAQPTASPSSTTTYTVTVTGANGCTATDVVTVTVDNSAPTADAGNDMTLDCNTSSGVIGSTAIGGNTYSWSPSSGLSATNIAQPTANPSSTTSYTVIVTGSNGCTASDVVTVTVDNTAPMADAGNPLTLNCTTTSGTIGTAAVGGNTYSWSPSSGLSATNIAQPTANPTSTTSYTITVTGSNGCTASDVVTVTVDNTAPTADAGNPLTLNCTTTSGTIGTPAVVGNTYSWSPSSGLSATNSAQPSASPSSTTTYTVTVTGANGCTATDVVTITVDNSAPTADAGNDMTLDCNTSSGVIGSTAIGGNTYSWSPSSGLSATNIAQPTANPSSTTSYTVIVTGSNGCTASDVVTVTVDNTAPMADAGNPLTLNCTTTSGTIGTAAVGGNTYSWSPSSGLSATNIAQPTANPTSTTSYTVTVTGSNGCTASDVVTVTVDNTAPTVDAGNPISLDCITTSGTIGTPAVGGYSYNWSPSLGLSATNVAQPSASPSITTTYTVVVTGANGCTASDVVTVTVDPSVPTADAGNDMTVDCNTASVTIGTPSLAGNTYSWAPAAGLSATNSAQPIANPSGTTTYTVTVTGTSGCTATDVVTVTVDTNPPTAGITGNTTVCNNGTTNLTATGGVAYSWNPGGANTASISATTGTYTVTVTGANGCTATTVVTINSVQGSIGNYVWYDANGNGIFDENPTLGINNITVELWKETAPSSGIYTLDQTTTTANNVSSEPGYYQFIICESANYKVKFPLSSGGQPLTTQTATAGTDNNSDPDRSTGESPVVAIDVNGSGMAKDNTTIDAAYYKPAQLGNYVWHDMDKDGIQDGNEVGVSGVTVTLYNSVNNAIVGATVTDAYGYYKFNPLAPGTYYVGFTVPANYIITGQDQTADAADSDPNATSGLTGNYTIVAGDSNMTVDAGIYVPGTSLACLGDKVWMDMDQDGVQDANEVGVAGVTVTLNNAAGDPIATTITNANGLYSFCDLQPGTYSVTFSKPIGYVLTGLDLGGDDTQDSDADPITGQTSTVTLVAGDNNLTLDAGIYPQTPTNAGLGNYVWNDVNNNGIQDANETGVTGVTVTLYGPDGTTVIGTTVTDELGYYIFNNLTPGTYVVGFSNLPAGFSFSSPDQGGNDATDSDPDAGTGKTAPVTLTSGEFNLTLDAGIHNPSLPTAALGNYVWYDWNKNGVQDATENGVAGVTVTLYASDGTTVLDNTVTNLTGFYLFDNLAAGSYVVGFSNIPSGFSFTTTDLGGNDATDSDPDLVSSKTPVIGLANGEVNLTLDAGIIENSGKNNLGSLGDRVWFDDNLNGIQDVGENGVSGVTVTLYQADGTTVIQTKETDVLGNYIFTGLGAGSYVVGFSNIPVGYTFTTANQGGDDALDADADATSSGKTPVVNLALGEENLTLDAGIFAAPGLASLGNYVWIDVDQDGLQDANEPGVAGVTVSLYDNAGNLLETTTTDPYGLYQFTGLTPDTYSVGFSNLPSGYQLTDADQGGNDTQDSDADVATGLTPSVTLIAGQNYPDFDAGIFTNLASLGNYVWSDLDQDGIQDPLEEGIPGITVTLYAADGITPISTAVTNAAGFYNFVNLTPGTYVVDFSNIPNGSQFSPANQGSDDALDSDAEITDGKTAPVTLSAGEYNPTLDAGIFTPLGAGLGDFVWFDLNNDGQQDANEPGVPGVTAILNDAGGNPIKSTITDASGYYTFPNLPPGTYSVTFTTLPYNRLFTTQNSGSDAGDNDVASVVNLPSGYPQSGTTATYTLAAGEYNPTIDAGMFTGIPLSVDAIHATATLQGQTSRVQWVTIDEKNVHHFEIERSTNGSQFVKVATHAALGNTQGEHAYQISDDVADLMSEQVIYYRVKVMDIDGRFVYSNITSVRPAVSGQMSAYPSPFNASFTIDYQSDNDGEVDIVLTDMAGRKVLSQTRMVKEGSNQITITGLQGLAAGQYSVRIKDFNTDAEFVLKVEKQ